MYHIEYKETNNNTFFAPQLFIRSGVSDISFYSKHSEQLKSGRGETMMVVFMLLNFPNAHGLKMLLFADRFETKGGLYTRKNPLQLLHIINYFM
jgi:hypothetical protein